MKKTFKRFFCGVLIMANVFCLPSIALAKEKVIRGTEDYYVELRDSQDVFIGNKNSIGTEVGTEYFMTYTVESMNVKEFVQEGVLGTNIPTFSYPYEKNEFGGGFLKYSTDKKNRLVVEGKTYFLKFTITREGFNYQIGWAEDENSKYLKFEELYGEVKTGLGHFGIWLGDAGITGKLIKVRIYDSKGNDLDVQVTDQKGNATVGREEPIVKDSDVPHTYTIKLKDGGDVAISNQKLPTSNKVYMEYKVKSSDTKAYQSGVILSNSPKDGYPYLNGYMLYDEYAYEAKDAHDGLLLVEGAEYLIVYEKRDYNFAVTVQQTLRGKVSYINFMLTYGTYTDTAQFYSLWFGGSGNGFVVNAELTDFKCYDSNKNNLGVQCNNMCEIVHYGELEEYADCVATYYCKEKDTLITLFEDKTLTVEKAGEKKEGFYRIEQSVMTTTVDNEKEKYDYRYLSFGNESTGVYRRLRTYKVVFDTGEGSTVEEQVASMENEYRVKVPKAPELKGKDFEGWYTLDGTQYDFDEVVTESITLYAKWSDVEYVNTSMLRNIEPFIAVVTCIIILVAAMVCARVIVKKGRAKDHV